MREEKRKKKWKSTAPPFDRFYFNFYGTIFFTLTTENFNIISLILWLDCMHAGNQVQIAYNIKLVQSSLFVTGNRDHRPSVMCARAEKLQVMHIRKRARTHFLCDLHSRVLTFWGLVECMRAPQDETQMSRVQFHCCPTFPQQSTHARACITFPSLTGCITLKKFSCFSETVASPQRA